MVIILLVMLFVIIIFSFIMDVYVEKKEEIKNMKIELENGMIKLIYFFDEVIIENLYVEIEVDSD